MMEKQLHHDTQPDAEDTILRAHTSCRRAHRRDALCCCRSGQKTHRGAPPSTRRPKQQPAPARWSSAQRPRTTRKLSIECREVHKTVARRLEDCSPTRGRHCRRRLAQRDSASAAKEQLHANSSDPLQCHRQSWRLAENQRDAGCPPPASGERRHRRTPEQRSRHLRKLSAWRLRSSISHRVPLEAPAFAQRSLGKTWCGLRRTQPTSRQRDTYNAAATRNNATAARCSTSQSTERAARSCARSRSR